MLYESKRLKNTHTIWKKGFSIIAEDDDDERDLVECKEAAKHIGTLASVLVGFVLFGTNVNDASRINTKASESIDEMFSLLIPRLTTNKIEPELPVERKEDARCAVYTVGPYNCYYAVCELTDRGAGLWLGTAGRSVAHASIGTVTREREIDACHESL